MMHGVNKHSYKHLDKEVNNRFNNAVIELNMEQMAQLVFQCNNGIHRFISEYADLCNANGCNKEFADSLVEAIETKY